MAWAYAGLGLLAGLTVADVDQLVQTCRVLRRRRRAAAVSPFSASAEPAREHGGRANKGVVSTDPGDARWVVSVRTGSEAVHDYEPMVLAEALALAVAVRQCWPAYQVHLARRRPLRASAPAGTDAQPPGRAA